MLNKNKPIVWRKAFLLHKHIHRPSTYTYTQIYIGIYIRIEDQATRLHWVEYSRKTQQYSLVYPVSSYAICSGSLYL